MVKHPHDIGNSKENQTGHQHGEDPDCAADDPMEEPNDEVLVVHVQ